MASAATARMTTRVEREQDITVIIEASLAAPDTSGFAAETTMTTMTTTVPSATATANPAISSTRDPAGTDRASNDVFDTYVGTGAREATGAAADDERPVTPTDMLGSNTRGGDDHLQQWADQQQQQHDVEAQDRFTDMLDAGPRTLKLEDDYAEHGGAKGDQIESWQRRQAIEAAHEEGLAYYDGTTTIDGQEVQKWIMPNGSTVYFDAETETVVDVRWQSDNAKDAAMEAAHDSGDPFFEGTTTVDGELVEVWVMPDGSTAFVSVDDRDVVGYEWPPGESPEYQGQVSLDGESLSLILLPNGEQVLVDEDGDFVAHLDDVDLDTTTDPIFGEVYAVPSGPPDYGTRYYDADTGEAVMGFDTGHSDPAGIYSYYQPLGEDYVLVLDADGNVVGAYELPPDEVWSVLGVVTYYEDGALTVDVGVAELTVDLGADGGIWFSSDGLGELIEGADWVGSVEAGIAWDEEGIDVNVSAGVGGVGEFGYGFSIGDDGFDAYVDVAMGLDIGGQGIGFELHGDVGITSDGTVYGGVDAGMSMSIPGGPDIELDVNAYVELGPDGFEGTAGWDGKVGMFGVYLEGGEQYSLTIDDEGLTGTYEYYRGAGIEGVGSVRAGGEVQVHTDGTRDGTSATAGVFGAATDRHGDETAFGGIYATADRDGIGAPEVRDEHLDTGVTKEDYDRHADDEGPADTVDGETGVEWRHDVLGETAEPRTAPTPKVRLGTAEHDESPRPSEHRLPDSVPPGSEESSPRDALEQRRGVDAPGIDERLGARAGGADRQPGLDDRAAGGPDAGGDMDDDITMLRPHHPGGVQVSDSRLAGVDGPTFETDRRPDSFELDDRLDDRVEPIVPDRPLDGDRLENDRLDGAPLDGGGFEGSDAGSSPVDAVHLRTADRVAADRTVFEPNDEPVLLDDIAPGSRIESLDQPKLTADAMPAVGTTLESKPDAVIQRLPDDSAPGPVHFDEPIHDVGLAVPDLDDVPFGDFDDTDTRPMANVVDLDHGVGVDVADDDVLDADG